MGADRDRTVVTLHQGELVEVQLFAGRGKRELGPAVVQIAEVHPARPAGTFAEAFCIAAEDPDDEGELMGGALADRHTAR